MTKITREEAERRLLAAMEKQCVPLIMRREKFVTDARYIVKVGDEFVRRVMGDASTKPAEAKVFLTTDESEALMMYRGGALAVLNYIMQDSERVDKDIHLLACGRAP